MAEPEQLKQEIHKALYGEATTINITPQNNAIAILTEYILALEKRLASLETSRFNSLQDRI